MQVVVEAQVEVGVIRRGPWRKRHQRQPHAVHAMRRENVGAIVDEVGKPDRAHCPLLWNFTTRESGAPAGRYFTVTSKPPVCRSSSSSGRSPGFGGASPKRTSIISTVSR